MVYDTEAEYDAEIAIVQANIHKAMTGEEWSLNTSQSNQRVKMASLDKLQKYLDWLIKQKNAFLQRANGNGVVSIVPRRSY
jgi:hypothetical protein